MSTTQPQTKDEQRKRRRSNRESCKGMKRFWKKTLEKSTKTIVDTTKTIIGEGTEESNHSNLIIPSADIELGLSDRRQQQEGSSSFHQSRASCRSFLGISKRSANQAVLLEDIKTRKRKIYSGSTCVYVVLAIASIGFGLSTYYLLRAANENKFESEFQSFANETADLAENNAENTFGQLQTLATAITSVVATSENQFPNVTIPHFDLRAQEIADLTGAEMIMFVPFVEKANRSGFEEYAVANQGWIQEDYSLRGWETSNIKPISSQIQRCTYCQTINDTRRGFVDADDFMEGIMSNLSYEVEQFSAPILQYGPAPTANTSLALMDLWDHPTFKKEIVAGLEYDVPVISESIGLDFLLQFIQPSGQPAFDDTLRSFTLDPVKEGFEPDSKTVGYLIGVVPWKTFFRNLLPPNVNGIVVRVESDCQRNFTYVINGSPFEDDLAIEGDHHDPKYADLSQRYKFFWKDHPKGLSRHCHFDLIVYPSDDFHASYESNAPQYYAGMVFVVFLFTAAVFALYDVFVYRRQKAIIDNAQNMVIENAQDSARKERELNDFIAHEVRNPLAAAMSACSFVSSAVLDESKPLIDDEEERKTVEDDIHIIESSLHFINDLLRNMLDMHRAKTNQLQINTEPTHVLNDILKPVDCMLHKRGSSFDVLVECDVKDVVILADKLRLKQIMLNLARNSVKFVEKGFIRLKCQLSTKGMVQLSVEDSGPGIPPSKRKQLFRRFQESLDSLHQGTGIGLSLCKQLSDLMGAQLYIDENYDSGIPGCPGARFVIDLNIPTMEWTDDVLDEYHDSMNFDGISRTPKKVLSGREDGTVNTSKPIVSCDSSNNATVPEEEEEEEEKRWCNIPPPDEGDCEELIEEETTTSHRQRFKELPTELRVLFVDDDMVLRKLFCRSVKKLCPGWILKEASNGETSLTMTAEDTFDIIFMDQYMASVQKQLLGTETTRALRAQGVTSRICGLSANDVEEAFFEAGADTFMIKPFPCKPDPLKEELLRVLNDKRNRTVSFVTGAGTVAGSDLNNTTKSLPNIKFDTPLKGSKDTNDTTATTFPEETMHKSARVSMTGEVC